MLIQFSICSIQCIHLLQVNHCMYGGTTHWMSFAYDTVVSNHTLSLHACMLIQFHVWCKFLSYCGNFSSHVVVTFLYVKERCNFYIVLACMHAYSILHPLAWSLNAWLVSGSNRIGLWATSSRSVGFLSNAPDKWSIRGHAGRPPRRRGLIFLISKKIELQGYMCDGRFLTGQTAPWGCTDHKLITH
jgi:hypothetical protein